MIENLKRPGIQFLIPGSFIYMHRDLSRTEEEQRKWEIGPWKPISKINYRSRYTR